MFTAFVIYCLFYFVTRFGAFIMTLHDIKHKKQKDRYDPLVGLLFILVPIIIEIFAFFALLWHLGSNCGEYIMLFLEFLAENLIK